MIVYLIDARVHNGIGTGSDPSLLLKDKASGRNIYTFPTRPQPPLAYLYFKPLLEAKGIECRLICVWKLLRQGDLDPLNFYRDWECYVKKLGAGIFAFTTNAQYYPTVINLSAGCKAACAANIVIHGGPQASCAGEAVIERFPWVDYVVKGEGEILFPALLEALDRGETPRYRGILYREEGRLAEGRESCAPIRMQAIPRPDFTLAPAADFAELEDEPHLLIETTRGCLYNCSFCTKARAQFSAKPVGQVMEELELALATFGRVRQITFVSNLIYAREEQLREFCQAYLSRGFRIPWGCFTRIEHMKREVLQLMAEAGCHVIHFGLETGSPAIQEVINKRIDLTRALQTITLTLEQGITPVVNFIIGFPEETAETLNQTLAVMLKLQKMGARVYPTILSPHLNTRYYEEYRSHLVFNEYRRQEIFFTEDLELIRSHADIFSFFYYIQPRHFSVQEIEEIYLFLIRELITKIPEVVKAAGASIQYHYIRLGREFLNYLQEQSLDPYALMLAGTMAEHFKIFAKERMHAHITV